MTANPRFRPLSLQYLRGLVFGTLVLGTLVLTMGAGPACAQSSGVDESVGPDGMTQSLQLTAVQRNAIYNAVMQHGMHSSSERIAATVGARVPPSVTLYDVPDQASLGANGDGALKYAMVEGQVVVVDPISMRVVGVIRQGGKP